MFIKHPLIKFGVKVAIINAIKASQSDIIQVVGNLQATHSQPAYSVVVRI